MNNQATNFLVCLSILAGYFFIMKEKQIKSIITGIVKNMYVKGKVKVKVKS